MNKIEFTTSWDLSPKLVTLAAALALCGVSVMSIKDITAVSFSQSPVSFSLMVFAVIIGPVTLGCCFLFHPRNYYVENGDLCIDRPCGARRIPLTSIKSAGLPGPSFQRGITRLFGVGGLFGYFGLFSHGKYGRFRMFATRGGNHVFLKTDSGNFVLTPDSPRVFLSYLNSRGGKTDIDIA